MAAAARRPAGQGRCGRSPATTGAAIDSRNRRPPCGPVTAPAAPGRGVRPHDDRAESGDRPGSPRPGSCPGPSRARASTSARMSLLIGDGAGERRLALTADATAWRGGPLDPAGAQPGDRGGDPAAPVPARRGRPDLGQHRPGHRHHRRARLGDSLLVDEGATRTAPGRDIPRRAAGRIQVTLPEPAARLPDRHHRDPAARARSRAWIPATRSRRTAVDQVPAPPILLAATCRTRSADRRSGTSRRRAVRRARRLLPGPRPGGRVRRGRQGRARAAPRLPCAALPRHRQRAHRAQRVHRHLVDAAGHRLRRRSARLFNDRCVACGTSPRGRVADLTLASFVALGGELERGLLQRDDDDRPLTC